MWVCCARDYWIDRNVHQTSGDHLQRIVDFARRQVLMPPGQAVKPPVVRPRERDIFVEDLQMYGFKDETYFAWGPGGGLILTSEGDMAKVVEFTGKAPAKPSLLYK